MRHLVTAAAIFALAGTVPAGASSFTVHTAAGDYRGEPVKGARLFANIAYAKPPVGLFRWRPSVLEDRARQRPRSVQCEQALVDTLPVDPTQDMDEDCLYLNVWAPQAGERHPVVLFIHGGAYLTGSGIKSFYDGSVFARRGVVFVGFNYRLGSLGFGPRYSGEPGSPGFHDQANALRWVIRNIGRFGGDPSRIYLMGQSKGAEATIALLESGVADEHVKGAVALSGPRHFEPGGNGSAAPGFLAGEPFLEAHDLLAERGFSVLSSELPAVRQGNGGGPRFRVLVSGIHEELGGAIFCYDLNFLRSAYDYVDSYFYVLHPGKRDHGAELRSLFAEDDYGRLLLDHLVHFVSEGEPYAPHFFGSARPFRESSEVIHLYPKFTVTETYRGAGSVDGGCPKPAGLRAIKLSLLEALSRRLGGGSAQPDFDAAETVR